MKTGIIIQARLGSTRLPGKVLLPLAGKTVLECLLERLQSKKNDADIIIATTASASDDKIVNFCQENGFSYFRGSEQDVLARYYGAALQYGISVVVRITSDCPLLDVDLLDEMLDEFRLFSEVDYYSNCLKRTYPRGFDIEIFTFDSLRTAYENAIMPYEREHVTPYIWQNKKGYFKIKDKIGVEDYSHLRLTLDTREDYELINAIYEKNFNIIPTTNYSFIRKLYETNRGIFEVNKDIKQKGLNV
ncbi:MAG: 3-deoxy-manno-octulosonate cytidylyltransferase [Pelotomaculum sp. PtaB.Bin104]|nr:MAG: 3-deoxy-manno-octulosonate cytidylyltransferase [Pelotomaculum sp. PtaB.Bin104]